MYVGQCDQAWRFLHFDNFLKPWATINLPKSPTFLGNFCKGVKISHFSSKIIFCNFYRHLAIFSGHTDVGTYKYVGTYKTLEGRFRSLSIRRSWSCEIV